MIVWSAAWFCFENGKCLVARNIIDALHLRQTFKRLLNVQNLVFRRVRIEINADVDLVLDGRRGAARHDAEEDEPCENEKRKRHDDDRDRREPAVPPEILETEMENARDDGEH